MDIEILREYLTAVREPSFTSAAAKLNLVQTTLSRHIELLEEEVGVPLFDRTPYGSTPTRAGRVFFERVSDALAAYDGALEAARQEARRVETVRVGGNFRDERVMMLASSAAVAATRRLSGVAVELDAHHASFDHAELAAHDVAGSLTSGEVDILISIADRERDWSPFEAVPLCPAPIRAFVSERHPLAGRRGLGLRDLAGYPVMRLNIHDGFGDGVRAMYARAGVPYEERSRLPRTEADMFFARNDEEVMWLPEGTAGRVPTAAVSGLVGLGVSGTEGELLTWAVPRAAPRARSPTSTATPSRASSRQASWAASTATCTTAAATWARRWPPAA